MKRRAARDFAETLAELVGTGLSWERLDIRATPYRGDLLFRAASQRMFILKCAIGKGPLPFPVLQDLRAMPNVPGYPGAPGPPLTVLVTSHALDDRIWAAFASSRILIIGCPPQETPAVMILRVLDVLMTLEKAATGTAGSEDIDRLVTRISSEKTAGATAGAASALLQLGAYRDAAHLYSMSLGDLFYRLGGDDLAVLELRSQFADALFWDGRRDEAEREHQVVYQRRCVILGQGHPDSLAALSKLQALERSRNR